MGGTARLDLGSLSFPQLGPLRSKVLTTLVETSRGSDAAERLMVGPRAAVDVERNTRIHELPTAPAWLVYAGPLYAALDPATLSPAARRRAVTRLVILSSLWGALRPTDPIPAYRLDICSHLRGLEGLEPLWRAALPDVLAEAAGERGPVIDVRSSSYRAMGMPAVSRERMLTVRVLDEAGRGAAGATAKRVRGEAVRRLLEAGGEPGRPEDVVDVLAPECRASVEWRNGAAFLELTADR